MDLDALLLRHSGTDDPDMIDGVALALGKERLTLAFGLERDPGRRFGLWTLMEVFGVSPPPAEAFANDAALKRAEDHLSATWRLERD